MVGVRVKSLQYLCESPVPVCVCVSAHALAKKAILYFKWANSFNCLLAHTQQQRGHVSQEPPDVP